MTFWIGLGVGAVVVVAIVALVIWRLNVDPPRFGPW